MSEAPVTDALAGLVDAIGGGDFPAAFLRTMHALAGVELCSVFRREGAGVQLVFAAGDPHDFSLHASRDYARGWWRSDTQLARLARLPQGSALVVRRRAADIADPAYRAACYDRAGVTERLSILWPGNPCFIANGYRTGSAPFTAHDTRQLEGHAAILRAALNQHLRAARATGHLFSHASLVERLLALDCGLSTREAEVAAAMILGETQQEIARARDLSAATIVTYRRRAYGKLGVSSRRALVALHRRLIAEPPSQGTGA